MNASFEETRVKFYALRLSNPLNIRWQIGGGHQTVMAGQHNRLSAGQRLADFTPYPILVIENTINSEGMLGNHQQHCITVGQVTQQRRLKIGLVNAGIIHENFSIKDSTKLFGKPVGERPCGTAITDE